MNNDLISRSELKKAFNKWWGCEDIPSSVVEDIIDEAPAVLTDEELRVLKVKVETYQTAYRIISSAFEGEVKKHTRQHGEWNYIQAGMCVCPFCGAIPHKLYKDFCAKCGADMRPKKKLQTPSCLTNPERQAELLERYKEE